jgi:hypothetical protein
MRRRPQSGTALRITKSQKSYRKRKKPSQKKWKCPRPYSALPPIHERNKKVLNFKTLKNISNASPIEIIPPEIIFKDIEANYTYEITVLVRNLAKKPRRIRIG